MTREEESVSDDMINHPPHYRLADTIRRLAAQVENNKKESTDE